MPKKILVVEDNEQNAVLFKDILALHGYEVIEARNGEEAVKKAVEEKPDLVLMDIQLPVMDGMTAARAIKADPAARDIKIIAVTSYALKGDKEKMLEAGFADYIAKPINTRELPGLVKNFLEK